MPSLSLKRKGQKVVTDKLSLVGGYHSCSSSFGMCRAVLIL